MPRMQPSTYKRSKLERSTSLPVFNIEPTACEVIETKKSEVIEVKKVLKLKNKLFKMITKNLNLKIG